MAAPPLVRSGMENAVFLRGSFMLKKGGACQSAIDVKSALWPKGRTAIIGDFTFPYLQEHADKYNRHAPVLDQKAIV